MKSFVTVTDKVYSDTDLFVYSSRAFYDTGCSRLLLIFFQFIVGPKFHLWPKSSLKNMRSVTFF